jgi:hypothetical protein
MMTVLTGTFRPSLTLCSAVAHASPSTSHLCHPRPQPEPPRARARNDWNEVRSRSCLPSTRLKRGQVILRSPAVPADGRQNSAAVDITPVSRQPNQGCQGA